MHSIFLSNGDDSPPPLPTRTIAWMPSVSTQHWRSARRHQWAVTTKGYFAGLNSDGNWSVIGQNIRGFDISPDEFRRFRRFGCRLIAQIATANSAEIHRRKDTRQLRDQATQPWERPLCLKSSLRDSSGLFRMYIIEGSLEVELPTIWTDGKAEVGRVREEKRSREQIREEKESEERRCRCAKRPKRFTVLVQWFVAPEGRKVGSLKRRVRRDERWKIARRCGAKHMSKCTKHFMLGALLEVVIPKKCTTLWCEARFEVKSVENWRSRTTFGSWDVEKVRTLGARSTCPSQNVQSTRFGALSEVEMSKKCTLLWRSTFRSQKWKKNWGVRSTFGRSHVGFSWQAQGILHLAKSEQKREGFVAVSNTTTTTLHYTTLRYTPLELQLQLKLQLQLQLHDATLH